MFIPRSFVILQLHRESEAKNASRSLQLLKNATVWLGDVCRAGSNLRGTQGGEQGQSIT